MSVWFGPGLCVGAYRQGPGMSRDDPPPSWAGKGACHSVTSDPQKVSHPLPDTLHVETCHLFINVSVV